MSTLYHSEIEHSELLINRHNGLYDLLVIALSISIFLIGKWFLKRLTRFIQSLKMVKNI